MNESLDWKFIILKVLFCRIIHYISMTNVICWVSLSKSFFINDDYVRASLSIFNVPPQVINRLTSGEWGCLLDNAPRLTVGQSNSSFIYISIYMYTYIFIYIYIYIHNIYLKKKTNIWNLRKKYFPLNHNRPFCHFETPLL